MSGVKEDLETAIGIMREGWREENEEKILA